MNALLDSLYWFCTDFCIHAANLLQMSYQELNTLLFLVAMPLTLLLLGVLNIYRYLLYPLVCRLRNKSVR